MKKILSAILVLSLLLSQLMIISFVSAEATSVVKDEFRILTVGNEKDPTSSIKEYNENELNVGDLGGTTKVSTNGNKTVRVLKAGDYNIFKIEIDKNATAIQLADFKIDSADGGLYQYHFYLSNDNSMYNIIGSYNGWDGQARTITEHGDDFSWATVDQGWIRKDNNKNTVAGAPLNDAGDKKVLYLKLSAKGGNSEDASDIDANAQISYVSFVVQSVVPETSITKKTGTFVKNEFRILTAGNDKDSTSSIKEYNENELNVGDLDGETKVSTNGNKTVRVLKAGANNTFKIEIDKNATAIQLSDFKIDSADGGLYQYHFYLSNDNSMYNIIGSYNGWDGQARTITEHSDDFSWATVDQGWIRADNNKNTVAGAPLNEAGDKKVLYLKLSAKGGNSEDASDIDANAQISYVSFVVQSVVTVVENEDEDEGSENEAPSLKEEFRIIANGNEKNANSEIAEYFEDELKTKDLQGVVNTTADGQSKVRVLKGGEENVFRIEIDKNATEIKLNNFVLNSADGELYQYHFYLSDDGTNFHIIGSYDNSDGLSIREYGDTFSWDTVDQGWIRAQNNKDIVGRTSLNENETKKVLYLKLSAKGGDCQNPNDIDSEAQIAYVSFDVQSIVTSKEENDGTGDNFGGNSGDNSGDNGSSGGSEDKETNIKNEFRIIASGNKKSSNSKIPEYFEDELKVKDLQGVVNTTADGQSKVRVLKGGEENVFRIEIDPKATRIRLSDIVLNSADGELYQYHFYLSDDGGKSYHIIGSYDNSDGLSIREYGDTFSWDTVDQGWIRAQNNNEIVMRAGYNEAYDKKVLYLKVSAKGGDCQNPDDIDENAQFSYVSFIVQSEVDPTLPDPVVPEKSNTYVKDVFRIITNGNTKNKNSKISEYFEDEVKVGKLQGEIKTTAKGNSKVRILKNGQENVFRIEVDKQATSIMINDLILDSDDGSLLEYHFYLSDDGGKTYHIIGSYDNSDNLSTPEYGETFGWDIVDQGWIRALNNTDIVKRAPLNEAGNKKVVYLKISTANYTVSPTEVKENAEFSYVSFGVQTIIDPDFEYIPPSEDEDSGTTTEPVKIDNSEYVTINEFNILANGNKKNEASEIPEYFEDELKIGNLEGELKTTSDGKNKVRVLKAGQANVFKLEVNANAAAIMINNIKLNSADGELYQYHFYLSDDGTNFHIIGSYDNSDALSIREYGDTFSWDTVDQGWIRAQNNLDIVKRAPKNDEGNKKVLYLKVSSKGGDCQNPDDIDPEAEFAYVSFSVQTLVDPDDLTGTEISAIRYDASPLRIDGMTDEEWEKQQEFYSVYKYLGNRVSDSDRRVEYGNIWSEITMVESEEMSLVSGKEGFITYSVDLNDKACDFTFEVFGSLRNVVFLASKDEGKTWYLIGNVNENGRGVLAENSLPLGGININECQKNIEWILTGNPEKKFQIRIQSLGDNSVLQMLNLVIYQEYIVDEKLAKELPLEVPSDYETPEVYNLVLKGTNDVSVELNNTTEKADINSSAIVLLVLASVLLLAGITSIIIVTKSKKR